MLLCEIVSTVPFSWTEKEENEYVAEFMVGQQFYRVTIERFERDPFPNEPCWDIEFKLLMGKTVNKYGMVGYGDENVGNASAVFGTVINIVKQWIQMAKPTLIKFEALDDRRTLLYSRLLNTLKQPNWTISKHKQADETVFIVRIK